MSAESAKYRADSAARSFEMTADTLVKALWGESAWALASRFVAPLRSSGPAFVSKTTGDSFVVSDYRGNHYSPRSLKNILNLAGSLEESGERNFFLSCDDQRLGLHELMELDVLDAAAEASILAAAGAAAKARSREFPACERREAALIRIKASIISEVGEPPIIRPKESLRLSKFSLQAKNSSLVADFLSEEGMTKDLELVNSAGPLECSPKEPFFSAEVCVGQVELSLSEFLSLRPGVKITLPSNPAIRGVLSIAGVPQAAGLLRIADGKVDFTIDEIFWAGKATKNKSAR